MRKLFLLILRTELLLLARSPRDILQPLAFFVLVVSLFPLAITPDPKILPVIGSGVIWVAALLATLLSLPRLFVTDFMDGTLEQIVLKVKPLSIVVFAKVCSHWLGTGLPLVLITPLLGYTFHLSTAAILTLSFSLLLGTPILSVLGTIASALTITLRDAQMLSALIVFPLYIPVLIFGASSVLLLQAGLSIQGDLAMLLALLILSFALAPLVTAAALRISMSY